MCKSESVDRVEACKGGHQQCVSGLPKYPVENCGGLSAGQVVFLLSTVCLSEWATDLD